MANPHHTVDVPPEFRAPFAVAEKLVAEFFADMKAEPAQGRIRIRDERYILVRAGGLSVEFFTLVRGLFAADRHADADEFSRNFLYDLAHALGRSDARRFHREMQLEDALERLAPGPVHFAFAGWASVRLTEPPAVADGPEWRLGYEHPSSFEADAWLAAEQQPAFPVCIMNAGYSSGWASESFGFPLVACELSCRGRGDDRCSFVMAQPGSIERHVAELSAGRAHLPERVITIPDFFSRKRIEEELREARDELEERVRIRTAELERSLSRLQREQSARVRVEQELAQSRRLDTIGKLAGGIAHDFGNLMSVIVNRAEILELDQLSPEQHENLRVILAACERSMALTEQLRRVSRGEVPKARAVEIDTLVEQLIQLADRGLGGDYRVKLDAERSGLSTWIDPGQLEQVFLNLLVNARDAMPDGGTIDVRVQARRGRQLPRESRHLQHGGPWVRVQVRDRGVGIQPTDMARIFEPTFTTKGVGQGTGLGLATVSSIVERAGGTISVESRPGEGSIFSVWLPHRTEAPVDDSDISVAPE